MLGAVRDYSRSLGAKQLSRVLRSKITYRSVSVEVRKEAYIQAGVSGQVAAMLSFVDAGFIATGSEGAPRTT